ncbi:MAG TPA: hypothetical protein VF733_06500 [Candidatus Saccharimonadales bacterium]
MHDGTRSWVQLVPAMYTGKAASIFDTAKLGVYYAAFRAVRHVTEALIK